MKIKEIFIHAVTFILLTVLNCFMLSFMQYNAMNPTLRYVELFAHGWKYWLPVVITGIAAAFWFKIYYPKYYK